MLISIRGTIDPMCLNKIHRFVGRKKFPGHSHTYVSKVGSSVCDVVLNNRQNDHSVELLGDLEKLRTVCVVQ